MRKASSHAPALTGKAGGRSHKPSTMEEALARSNSGPRASRTKNVRIEVKDSRVVCAIYRGKGAGGKDLTVQLRDLNAVPLLALKLAEAFVATYAIGRSVQGILMSAASLCEWARLMGRDYAAIDFEQLERKHLIEFRSHLDQMVRSGEIVRNKQTRAKIVRTVQKILRATNRCDHVAFLRRPYPSANETNLRSKGRQSARKVPTTDELRVLLVATLEEMRETITLWKAFNDPSHPANQDPKLGPVLTLARAIKTKHGYNLPEDNTLTFLRTSALKKVSVAKAISAYMPTLRAMAPFTIMLMIQLRLDGQMMSDLKQDKIREVTLVGVKRLQVDVWRSKVAQWKTCTAALTAQWHSPSKLLEFIKEWTGPVRTDSHKGHALIALATRGGRKIVPFNKDRFWVSIGAFCREAEVVRITSSIPRKIAIEIVDILSAGDLGIRSVAGNHSEAVDVRYYVSAEAGARMDEAFGVGQMMLSAHRREGGKTPDRRSYLPHEDVMAATPGWWCSQPFDGPIPGQSPNQPCTAYGMCPTCEHGEPDFDDPVSCKRIDLLLEAILRSEPNMAPDVWEGIWKPVADELSFKYRPMFEARPDVMSRAAELEIGPMMEVVCAQHI